MTVVRPGGTIVCAAECRDGFPDHGSYREVLASEAVPGGAARDDRGAGAHRPGPVAGPGPGQGPGHTPTWWCARRTSPPTTWPRPTSATPRTSPRPCWRRCTGRPRRPGLRAPRGPADHPVRRLARRSGCGSPADPASSASARGASGVPAAAWTGRRGNQTHRVGGLGRPERRVGGFLPPGARVRACRPPASRRGTRARRRRSPVPRPQRCRSSRVTVRTWP